MIVSIHVGTSHPYICSETILEDCDVLTTAHCLTNYSSRDITIEADMYYRSEIGIVIRSVDRIRIHSNYTVNSDAHINDIAISHLSLPFDVEDERDISQTCLPTINKQWINATQYPPKDIRLVISRWDITDTFRSPRSKMIQQTQVYVTDDRCSQCSVRDNQRSHQFCAGYRGSANSNRLIITFFCMVSFLGICPGGIRTLSFSLSKCFASDFLFFDCR